jgi:hypothetical protein
MTNRREFLQIGIAATAWPIASRAAMAATQSAAPVGAAVAAPVSLYKAVYDTRFPESVAFARQMEVEGVATHAIEADVTNFWYTELDQRWRKTPLAIAGLTSHGPLFCLEQLAWPLGMRVVFRGEHSYRADGSIEHALNGPDSMVRAASGLGEKSDWAASIAKLATRCPTGRSQVSAASFTCRAAGPTKAEADPLISWIIAPASKA